MRAANIISDIVPVDDDHSFPILDLDLDSMSIHQLHDSLGCDLVEWRYEPIPYCQ